MLRVSLSHPCGSRCSSTVSAPVARILTRQTGRSTVLRYVPNLSSISLTDRIILIIWERMAPERMKTKTYSGAILKHF